MRSDKWIFSVMVLLATTAMAGCESLTGPQGPSVAGTWTGDFRGTAVLMVLTQSGEEVAGTLEIGVRDYGVNGAVTESGAFTWSTNVRQSDCSSLSSSGLQLEVAASELNGVVRRASSAPPCGSGGSAFIQQGTMALSRAF